ncbi:MAG: hypothetical protein BMS9Abin05_0700 [Rhodothermia bacterium]|nr:MAG: hypothetical protein BMS9Abin05_0700 [Rhodothermia bacterium]
MVRNYLQVAVRNMRRSQVYALVNIVGLSIALASAILITAYVRYELSYESFLPEVQYATSFDNSSALGFCSSRCAFDRSSGG